MYHFHAAVILRSSRGSACAHAAYISASRIHDDRTGDTWDYTKKKREVLHTTILAPEGSPEWIYDGETPSGMLLKVLKISSLRKGSEATKIPLKMLKAKREKRSS
jgi:hypothetical protein